MSLLLYRYIVISYFIYYIFKILTSQFREIRTQNRKIVKFVKIMTQAFFNSESSYDKTDILTNFTVFNDFSVSRNLRLKAEMRRKARHEPAG